MKRMVALAVFVGCLAVWLLLALAISRAAYGQGTWVYNRVVRVIDGDTLVLNRGGSEVTCRLIGVNTPETKAPGKPVEFYGPEATVFVKLWLEGKTVRVDYETHPPKIDRYGRLLVYLYADKGRELINKTLLERGYARFETGYPTRFKAEFTEAEKTARSLSLGLWSNRPPDEPEPLREARRSLGIARKALDVYLDGPEVSEGAGLQLLRRVEHHRGEVFKLESRTND
jgi:micrococcal nuclease